MEQHDLKQGSAAWHAFRAAHYPASEAPAMLGESPYKTRTQLMHEKHTGITPEIDAATQRRFDDGHRFEALARPLAEEIVGEELFPITGSEGMLSASFDGLTMMGDIAFEHKSLNDEIRAAKSSDDLGLHYRIQMEQQLAVSGAEKCIFMATKWNGDGQLQEQVFHWYYPDMELRALIIAGWDQFAKDLAAYVPREIVEKPKADAILSLPALAIQIRGEVTLSNLPAFKEAASTFIANINTDLKTDDDFAQAEATVKFCKAAEDDLDAAKKAAIGQTASIDELMRTIDHIQAQLRDKRLVLDKAVKVQKEGIKETILKDAQRAYLDHVYALNEEIKPIELMIERPDFAGAMKNKRTLASLHDAVDSELASAKIIADTIALEIRRKLAWFNTEQVSHTLFPDLQAIIQKPFDDFCLTVTARVDKAEKEESAKFEAERQRMQQEEQAKAEAKVRAEQEEEIAKARAEEQAKAKAETDRVAAENQRIYEENKRIMDEAKAAAPDHQPATPVDIRAAVVEHQDEIAMFFKLRTFSTQKENEYRAVIVEFIKYQATHAMKKAA